LVWRRHWLPSECRHTRTDRRLAVEWRAWLRKLPPSPSLRCPHEGRWHLEGWSWAVVGRSEVSRKDWRHRALQRSAWVAVPEPSEQVVELLAAPPEVAALTAELRAGPPMGWALVVAAEAAPPVVEVANAEQPAVAGAKVEPADVKGEPAGLTVELMAAPPMH